MILSTEMIRCPFCESEGPFTVGHDAHGNETLTCDTCGEVVDVAFVEKVPSQPVVRTRAMHRFYDRCAVFRKQRIVKAIYLSSNYYDNFHQYSKNKIHCSCPLCQAKSTRRREGHVWAHSDEKKIQRMASQVQEFLTEDTKEVSA